MVAKPAVVTLEPASDCGHLVDDRKDTMKLIIAFSAILLGLPLCSSGAQGPGGTRNGYLKTKVDPGRAGVFVDGKYVGPAANFRVSRKYALPEGEHEIRLSDPRYEEVDRKLSIRAGEVTSLSERLRPLPLAKPPFGRLRTIHFDKYAAVYVNGRFYGHADEFSNFAQALLLNPGEYAIRIVPLAGGPEHAEKVKVESDKVTIVRAK